jgi:hypothetical protein
MERSDVPFECDDDQPLDEGDEQKGDGPHTHPCLRLKPSKQTWSLLSGAMSRRRPDGNTEEGGINNARPGLGTAVALEKKKKRERCRSRGSGQVVGKSMGRERKGRRRGRERERVGRERTSRGRCVSISRVIQNDDSPGAPLCGRLQGKPAVGSCRMRASQGLTPQ